MSTVQFWGLGSGLTNTPELIDAMLINDSMKIKGFESKIALAEGKKKAWGDLKASIDSMNDIIKKVSGVGNQNFKKGTTSLDGYLSATVSGNAMAMDYTINVKQLASKHAVSANKVSDINAPLNSAGTFRVNGVQIEVTSEDTLSSVMNKINTTKDADGNTAGVKAYIIDGVMVVESEETGVANTIKFEDESGILQNLGLVKEDGTANTTKEPQNAIIEINDILVERSSNVIDDAIEGVSLNLTKVTNDSITLKVENDTEVVKTMIKDFVAAFNDVMTKMNQYTSFDVAAKTSGLLNGDSTVSSIKTMLTSTMQQSFGGGDFGYLFDIGISIDKYGQYQIDESKLDKALQTNSDGVIDFFTKGLENPTSSADSSNGLFVSMKKTIDSLVSGADNIFSNKTTSLDAQIKTYNTMIDRTQLYMEKRRKTLEAQFAALETTMNSLNSTSSMLSQMQQSMTQKDD